MNRVCELRREWDGSLTAIYENEWGERIEIEREPPKRVHGVREFGHGYVMRHRGPAATGGATPRRPGHDLDGVGSG